MFGLTFIQPWASAVLLAGKDIENRPWAPTKAALGQRIAIHAGKKVDKADAWGLLQQLPQLTDVPRGAILGTAELAGWVKPSRASSFPFALESVALSEAEVDAVLRSQWRSPDSLCLWLLRGPRVLAQPIPWQGALGLWRVPAELEVLMNAALGTERQEARP